MAESAKTAVAKGHRTETLVVPADTVIAVVLDQTISFENKQAWRQVLSDRRISG